MKCLWCPERFTVVCSKLHAVFLATVVAKLSYASPAWLGYANADDEARLEEFPLRSSKLGFRADSALTLTSINAEADDKLFSNVLYNELHLLHPLLPAPRDNHYSLRSRMNHNLQLPLRTSSLNDLNFFIRLLFKDMNYSRASTQQVNILSV